MIDSLPDPASDSPPTLQTPPARRALCPLWLGIVLLLLIVGGSVVWAARNLAGAARPSTARVGSLAPEISLVRLDNGKKGERVTLSSLEGHPVVVNFWATWCGPCRAEFPAMQNQYLKHKDTHQLVVVGIDSLSDQGPAAAQQFVDSMGATFPIWLDDDGSAEQAYRIDALPTTVFIDRKGIIRDLVVGGPMTEEYLEKEINKLLD